MTDKYPNNERYVLTWIRDKSGVEYWQIDSYCPPIGWLTAQVWEQKVLYWQELPAKPKEVW